MRRLAWFSPMPPIRSGIAANSAELVAALGTSYEIDVFADRPSAAARSAHDFLWLHRSRPYDLTVYQVGNSSHHNFLWPYLFRFPGLTVLHDVHLHHARAALLLTEQRAEQYRAEFRANHPDACPDLAELAAAGFDSYLYYMWPMTRLVIEASRVAAVHTRAMAERLRQELPGAAVEVVRLTQGTPVTPDREARARSAVRARLRLPPGVLMFGVFGGLTPEKRIPQVLEAFAATRPSAPTAHLLLAGAPASQYDTAADVRARGLTDAVTITGYLETDDELTDAVAACDVVLNLRWPTAREVSGPWLRAMAAGKPTITIDLAHLWDVPSLDPRTWTANDAGGSHHVSSALPGSRAPGLTDSRAPGFPGSRAPGLPDSRAPGLPDSRAPGLPGSSGHPGTRASGPPVTVAVDILDEDHSLRLAMRRLATDAALRKSLGDAAHAYWRQEHSLEQSAGDYHRVIELALARDAPRPRLPPHLMNAGDRTLRALLEPFGVTVPFATGSSTV